MKGNKYLAVIISFVMCFSISIFNIATAEGATVTFEALDGTSNTNDGYEKLIDGNYETPWGSYWGGNSGTYAFIIFKASEEVVSDGYTFVTAKDCKSYKNRNPKNWTLSGCNDYDSELKTGSWTTLHTVTNDSVLQDVNTVSYKYSFENSNAYQYYKLEITANKGNDYMQLGEMILSYNIPGEISFSALDGKNGYNNENYDNLFDGETKTKWCVGGGAPFYVIAKTQESVNVIAYTLTTANDTASHSGRNPKSWTLYGCNDYDEQTKSGGTWTEIHSVENDISMPKENYTSQTFNCSGNTGLYQYYKLEITEIQDGEILQLSELGFTCDICEHEWAEEVIPIEATCVLPAYEIRTCTKCGKEKKTQAAPANGHTWVSELVQEATCIKPEYTTYRCSACQVTKTEQTGPLGRHQYNENGRCSVCNITVPAKIGDILYEDLPEAVNAAVEGDTITLIRNDEIDSTLNISKDNITLDLNSFTLSKTGSGSVIVIDEGKSFNMTDSSEAKTGTITGGSSTNGGGIYLSDNSTFTMTAGTISNCTATEYGGGVFVSENATFNMHGAVIKNCKSENAGGAIAAYSDSIVNVCDNSEISENVSASDGGAIYLNSSAANISGYSFIQNNSAENYSGGAIYAENNSTVTTDYCTISDNTAKGNGGGIYALNSAVTMTNGTVNSNNAVFGGGVYIHSSEFVMDGGEISSNTASRFGGGVMVQINNAKSSAIINDGDISGNVAEGDVNGGGGIWVNGSSNCSATLTVNGGHISDNIAKVGYGGGIRLQNSYSYLNLNGGTIIGNSAVLGGGIYNGGELSVTCAPHVYSNYLISGSEDMILNNIYLPSNKIILIGEGGLHTDAEDYTEPIIGITLENPTAVNTIVNCNSDYSFGFQSDDTKYVVTYDEENKKIFLGESVQIILQVNETEMLPVYILKGGVFDKPEYEPWQSGYRFLGWYKDGERYDFGQIVTEGFSLTAKWAKDDEAAIELTADSFIVSGLDDESVGKYTVYLASYNDEGVLVDAKRITATNTEMLIVKTLLNTDNAVKIKAFMWDDNMTPVCDNAVKTL